MSSFVKKYLWIVTLLAVLVISYLLAKITSLFIASQFPDVMIAVKLPKSAEQASADQEGRAVDIAVILKRNFFDAQETQFASDEDVKAEGEETTTAPDGTEQANVPPENQTAVKTSLDITLISTVAAGDGRNTMSSCVIRSGREQDVYRVAADPSFSPGTKIVRILPKRVEFLNKNRLEYVELIDFAKGMAAYSQPEPLEFGKPVRTKALEEELAADIQREGNTFQIPRVEVDKALANLGRLYTDIRAVPYFKDGKANGFKLLNVKQGSLFEKLGLRRGDILKSINGTVLDIATGMQLFNNLKNETRFTLDVERRGAEQTFSYDII